MAETLDPLPEERAPGAEPQEPALVVLHHPDLRCVGMVLQGKALTVGALSLGRDEPLFSSSGRAVSLGDPCISRNQLSIQRLARGFEVVASPSARRPVHLLDLDGRPLSSSAAPPGSLVAIGDRILLALLERPFARAASRFGLVGEGAAVVALRNRVAQVADGDEVALLLGQTGTGKELVARALHDANPRRLGPFVAVNCAALPEAIAESELFGHARGAFTGATEHRGLLAAADGGTLFLDEIGEMPLAVQAKLLRAIETRRVRPVGSTTERPVNVRIVAATHRDLDAMARDGLFRRDLLARIDGLRVCIPPLSGRREDIPTLFAHFLLEQLATDSARSPHSARLLADLTRAPDTSPPAFPLATSLALLAAPWPGNVRDVHHTAVAVAAAARTSGRLEVPLLALQGVGPAGSKERPSLEQLLALLEAHDHVQSRAAAALGVPPATFDRWMRELGAVRPRDLSAEQVERALRDAAGEVTAAAAALRVSARGLRLRMRDLGLSPR